MKWTRAKDGMILGVCKGLARNLDIPVGLFRFIWLLSVLMFGIGLGIYILFAVSLPREDYTRDQAMKPMILGVCSRIAQKTDIEVGIVRFLALLSLLSMGATILAYIVLHFVLEKDESKTTTSI